MANNIRRLTKHEMCMAMAAHDAGPQEANREDFSSSYENYFEDWLACFAFVKMLGESEALYMVVLHDDEGPNHYEGVACCYAHVNSAPAGGFTFRWAEWPPGM